MAGLSFNNKYNILLRRDVAYEGSFIVGVKTTGIFCRPVCSARKPKPANVIFFDTVEQAAAAGFRPCKKCRPLEHLNELPAAFKTIVTRLEGNPELRIKDADLVKLKIQPVQIRRWFKRNYQITFQAYQRLLRMNVAFRKLVEGKQVTGVAYTAGFDSLSGFNERFRKIFGQAPTKSKEAAIITVKQVLTPLGPMYAGTTNKGICFFEFIDRVNLQKELQQLCRQLNATMLPGNHPYLQQLEQEVNEYFAAKRKVFEVPIHFTGTGFQTQVWNALLAIPYGSTTTYSQQAAKLKMPRAVRAVATGNALNKMAIIVPCHRVIGTNGKLSGYAAGLPRKQWLINFEKQHNGN